MVKRVNMIPAKAKPSACPDNVWAAIQRQGRIVGIPAIGAKEAIRYTKGGWQFEPPVVEKAKVALDLDAMDDRTLALTAASVGIHLGGVNRKRMSRRQTVQAIEAKLAAIEFAPEDVED